MNDRKFCFIMCANDEFLAEECQKYIRQLELPDGYERQVIVIRGASSMTAGYNTAMKQTDAKYKIYLHQDVLLINRRLLHDILRLFQGDPGLGMLGVVGNPTLSDDGCPWSGERERRIGSVYGDCIDRMVYASFETVQGNCTKVLTIDGMLMITQYDLPWREDLFQGWDFYDGSQAMEFWKAGYAVAVPAMNRAWCIHDNDRQYLTHYEKWRSLFEREYRRYYQNVDARNLLSGRKLQPTRPVIWQIFRPEQTRYHFPYPPIYTEPDADYICFTDQKELRSKYWRIKYREELSEKSIREEMESLSLNRELHTDEIQISSLFVTAEAGQAVVQIPGFDELPYISFDPKLLVPTRDAQGNYIHKKNPVYRGGKYDGREYLLTLGMPVSNQIGTIDRCLSHVKPLLDNLDAELLIVNTGSTDGTLDVCRAYGARIIEFPWCNNMSAARNQGIYHAKGEWYMSLDDDEWFEDVDDILNFFQSGNYKNFDIAAYTQRNYTYSDEQIYTDTFALRMAKITPELHFEGRIHDALTFPDKSRGCQLSSYVHHYGFVADCTERKKEKYIRNVTGLLYDLSETPENLIYNYQLSQEFLAVGYYQLSCAYGFLGLSAELELDQSYYGRLHATRLMSALYYAEDARAFAVYELLKNRYSFTEAERAYFAYILADLGVRFAHEASEVLQHIEEYKIYLQAYERNELENRRLTFVGLDICINEQYRTDARVMEFWAQCELGDTKHAIEVLDVIQTEYIWYKRMLFIRQMLCAESEIYKKMLAKMSAPQFELWIADVMQVFREEHDYQQPWHWERILQIISYFSVQKLQQYFGTNGLNLSQQLKLQLEKQESLWSEKNLSVPALYLFAELAKQQMLAASEDVQKQELFKTYATLTGCFAQSYFHPVLLQDMDSAAIAPDVKAAYEIYLALTGINNNEKLTHLRRALNCFPGFKREIQVLLDEMQDEQKKQHEMSRELNALKQQLEQQLVVLRQQGKNDEADAIETEMKQIFASHC